MKKCICILLCIFTVLALSFSGCAVLNGKDGKDGKDLNIYDVYEATNAAREEKGLEQLDFLEFVEQYLHYEVQMTDDGNLRSSINRSLLCSVGIVAKFNYPISESKSFAGSGVIVDIDKENGNAYVITNAHVVYDTNASPSVVKSLEIYLYGNDDRNITGTEPITEVSLVTYALSYDIALLKIEGSEILKNSAACAAVFAESETVNIGEVVYTVGYPAAEGISVTQGIISRENEYIGIDFADGDSSSSDNSGSSYGKEIYVQRVMRTDAAVNGGSSGGALFDASGRILGIVNSKDPETVNENMGYALCGSYVKRLWKLMRDGYLNSESSYGVCRAVFPAEIGFTTDVEFDNVTNLVELTDTVCVLSAYGSFRTGDIIKRVEIIDGSGNTVDGLDVERYFNIDDVLLSARNGDIVVYTVERDGQTQQLRFEPLFENCA